MLQSMRILQSQKQNQIDKIVFSAFQYVEHLEYPEKICLQRSDDSHGM